MQAAAWTLSPSRIPARPGSRSGDRLRGQDGGPGESSAFLPVGELRALQGDGRQSPVPLQAENAKSRGPHSTQRSPLSYKTRVPATLRSKEKYVRVVPSARERALTFHGRSCHRGGDSRRQGALACPAVAATTLSSNYAPAGCATLLPAALLNSPRTT